MSAHYRKAMDAIEIITARMREMLSHSDSSYDGRKRLETMKNLMVQWEKIQLSPNMAELLDFALTARSLGESVLDRELVFTSSQAFDIIAGVVDERDAINRIWTYYCALCDMKVMCLDILGTGKAMSNNAINERARANVPAMSEEMSERLREIGQVFRSAIPGLTTPVLSVLRSFESAVANSPEAMGDALHLLTERIHRYALEVTGKMFDFVSAIQAVSAKRNFALREVSMELASPSVQLIEVNGFPTSVPLIEPPKIVFKFTPS